MNDKIPKLVDGPTVCGIMGQKDREFFDRHYGAIAQRMYELRIYGNPWTIQIEGCVYKFRPKGYAKKGSERWKEEQEECEDLPTSG